jgi:hypothetical protein
MTTNSYRKAPSTRPVAWGTRITLVATAVALVLASWPAIGQGQSSYRRDRSDRSRRDAPTGQDPTKSKSGRPEASKSQTAAPAGRIMGSAEPNAAPKSADKRSKGPAEKPRVPSAGQDALWAKYNLILQRNMFSRQRVPIQERDDRPAPPRIIPNPESYFLLRGVTYEDHPVGSNQFVAFVEDKQTGSVLRLHQGDRVARGTIKSLNLDGIEYELADKTTAVSMGFDLEGRHGAVTAGDLASYTPTAAPAASGAPTSPQAAPSADEAAILQRLMEQRKQQLGQ